MMEFTEFIDESTEVRTEATELLRQTSGLVRNIVDFHRDGHSTEVMAWQHPLYSLKEYIQALLAQWDVIDFLRGFESPAEKYKTQRVRIIMFHLQRLSEDIGDRIEEVCALFGYDGEDDDDDGGSPHRPDSGGRPSGKAIALSTELAV